MARLAFIILFLLPVCTTAQIVHEITVLDLGREAEDYAPVPHGDGFVMSSIRDREGIVDLVDEKTGRPLADLYHVSLKDGMAATPVLLSPQLTSIVNEGPAAFTRDGTGICFTRNLVVPKKLSKLKGTNGELGLFFSSLIDGSWQAPSPFEHNARDHAMMHPTFTRDGSLVFASNMPGGHGGFDLYISHRTASGWSAPENLGPTVNGPGNDVFPRMQHDGTLFFSSDRPGGLGKLDIYSTAQRSDGWQPPAALPAPINSPFNDVGFTLLQDGHDGIMSSDRGGNDRILLVKYTVEKFRECAPQQVNNHCYAFKGRKHAATNSLPLEHVWEMGDGNRLAGSSVNHCYAGPGKYEVRSLLVDKKTGTTFHVLSSNVMELTDHVQAFIAVPDTVRTGRQVAFDPSMSHHPGMTAAEYHWDLGDGNRRQTPRVIHQYRHPGVYEVKLDIISKPDAEGRIDNHCNTKKIVVMDKYREQEDQTVVAQYQDALGRTHAFEFQELPSDHFSLAMENNEDVTFSVTLFASKERVSLDDPRFIEVKKLYRVVERYDPEMKVYTYSVGETKNLEELYVVFQKVKELQFLDAEVFALQTEKLIDLSQLDLASLKELNHTKLRTSSIHFAFNSAELVDGTEEVLVQVLGLLRQHPQLHLVIEAHTDDVGTLKANMELSQQRAASVVSYLVDRGIDADRLFPVGHGKNQPIASNRTEAGRSKNRRVEFRMVVKEDLPSLVEIRK